MARFLQLNETYSIYRSRHTGAIGLWERNSVYGYDAALEYLPEGQCLTLRKLAAWAERAGVSFDEAKAKLTACIREGGHGMRPQPDFKLPESVV